MNVEELIKALGKADPHAEVCIQNGTFQYMRSIGKTIIADTEGHVATKMQGHDVKYRTGCPNVVFLMENR